MTEPVVLILAYLADLIIGDPREIPHPIRGIGHAIMKTEDILRRRSRDTVSGPACGDESMEFADAGRERVMGVFLVIIIAGLTYLISYLVNGLIMHPRSSGFGSFLLFVIMIYLVSTTIATRGLLRSGKEVIGKVKEGKYKHARKTLGMIVGRDTASLDRKGILRAVIETLSENASDGIIAPLFYFALGGLPLAMTYKAINTLDSMVGYKNGDYKNFGWASAKLDDIANYIPARITGLLIVCAAYIMGFTRDIKGNNSFRIMFRDGGKHSSPNSGVPEAAMAGALGVRLGGPSTYGGVIHEKPYIGDEEQDTKSSYLEASETAMSLVKITSVLGLVFALMLLSLRTAL